jgi:hypothetical protein
VTTAQVHFDFCQRAETLPDIQGELVEFWGEVEKRLGTVSCLGNQLFGNGGRIFGGTVQDRSNAWVFGLHSVLNDQSRWWDDFGKI